MSGNGEVLQNTGWEKEKVIRYALIAAFLLTAFIWSLAHAQQEMKRQSYPDNQYLVTGKWLLEHQDSEHIVIVDVRDCPCQTFFL